MLATEAGAGRAVLHGWLDRYEPGRGWAAAAHAALTSAVRAVEQAGARIPGLFGGVTGPAFAARALSRGGRYPALLTALNGEIDQVVGQQAAAVAAARDGVPFAAFDVVSGLAGQVAYLLDPSGTGGTPAREPAAALDTALTALVAVCGTTDGVPHWHTRPEQMLPGPMTAAFPAGVYNCGLAHGVTGPLAALALALRGGSVVPGQRAAVERVAGWLVDHVDADEWGPVWPDAVGLDGGSGRPRNAWCYGGVGVARALWLAGVALDDPALRDAALTTMAAIYRRPPAVRRLDASPGLCHGLAGLLQVTLRFAAETGDALFVAQAAVLAEQLIALADPARPYCYGSLADDGSLDDDPGLLDGAAGVALALLAAGTDVAPDWDRMLLIA